jgi:cyclophilin family peptidyl-prolyl cis-trans isomerase
VGCARCLPRASLPPFPPAPPAAARTLSRQAAAGLLACRPPPPPPDRNPSKKAYLRLHTSLGDLNLELHADIAPRTCENFLALAEMGYYDGTVFHRSIRNFMLQVGSSMGGAPGRGRGRGLAVAVAEAWLWPRPGRGMPGLAWGEGRWGGVGGGGAQPLQCHGCVLGAGSAAAPLRSVCGTARGSGRQHWLAAGRGPRTCTPAPAPAAPCRPASLQPHAGSCSQPLPAPSARTRTPLPPPPAQGGDPTGTGKGGESIYGPTFNDELDSRLLHSGRGMLAMANSGQHTNGSQFYVTYKSASHLNFKHTVFGRWAGGRGGGAGRGGEAGRGGRGARGAGRGARAGGRGRR